MIWPVERITADNVMFRSDSDVTSIYMPFDPLLFFADAGNGDQFALTPHLDRAGAQNLSVYAELELCQS